MKIDYKSSVLDDLKNYLKTKGIFDKNWEISDNV